MAVCIVKSGDEHFGAQRSELFGWKIDDADHLPSEELLLRVVMYDLRARLLDADLGAEIDAKAPSGLARFGKFLDLDDRADAQLDFLEIGPLDRVHVDLGVRE